MQTRALATDAVILLDGELVLLERASDPFEGHWVLPGGMVEPDERACEACVRETAEEVGLSVEPTTFVGLYDDPGRDERGNVSAAFLCRPVEPGQTPDPLEEAHRVQTFDPGDLPRLGFDHANIVSDALSV